MGTEGTVKYVLQKWKIYIKINAIEFLSQAAKHLNFKQSMVVVSVACFLEIDAYAPDVKSAERSNLLSCDSDKP